MRRLSAAAEAARRGRPHQGGLRATPVASAPPARRNTSSSSSRPTAARPGPTLEPCPSPSGTSRGRSRSSSTRRSTSTSTKSAASTRTWSRCEPFSPGRCRRAALTIRSCGGTRSTPTIQVEPIKHGTIAELLECLEVEDPDRSRQHRHRSRRAGRVRALAAADSAGACTRRTSRRRYRSTAICSPTSRMCSPTRRR